MVPKVSVYSQLTIVFKPVGKRLLWWKGLAKQSWWPEAEREVLHNRASSRPSESPSCLIILLIFKASLLPEFAESILSGNTPKETSRNVYFTNFLGVFQPVQLKTKINHHSHTFF